MKIKRNKLKRKTKKKIKNLKSQEIKEIDEKVLSSEEIRELAMKFALNPVKGQANTWLNLPSQQSKKFLF